MRWLPALFAVAGFAAALPLAAPAPAHGCSCAFPHDGSQLVEHVSHAASSFTGTATAERVDGYTAFFEFDVSEVFTGEVGATTVVSSSTQSSACGRGFEIGAEYLVFTTTYDTQGAPWSVDMCSATTRTPDQPTRDAAVAVYGTPSGPNPRVADVGIDNAAGGSPWWWVAAAGGGVVALAVVVRWRMRFPGR